jgi:SAM-dependent methyltransferase
MTSLSQPPDDATLREAVRATYAALASSDASGGDGSTEDVCCGPSCGCASGDDSGVSSMIGDEYDGVEGYVAEADLKLGCGVPTDLADLQPGEVVLDLGSGAGLDAFVARRFVEAEGRVEGVDITPEMVEKARANANDLGYDNVHFHEGDIEDLPVEDARFDVALSNCVLNLVPDKARAFNEMHRVLRAGGRFCISDIVVQGDLPDTIRCSAELYAGCVAGAMEREAYLGGLREAGFSSVKIVRERPIDVPDEVLAEAASTDEIQRFRENGGLLSVTVRGRKP